MKRLAYVLILLLVITYFGCPVLTGLYGPGGTGGGDGHNPALSTFVSLDNPDHEKGKDEPGGAIGG